MRRNRKQDSKKAFKSKDIIADDVEQELYIDDEYINEELMDQPLKYRKWAKFEVKCERKVKTLKLYLENAEAAAYKAAKRDGNKKTIKDIENEVQLDEEVIKLKEQLIDAEEELSDIKMVVRAFYQRHEMLKDISANLRKEMMD